MQIRAFRKDKDKRKQLIARLLAHPRELLVSFIIVIIIMSLLVQSLVSSLWGEKNNWLLNVGVPLALNLVLGEIIPKSLAMPNHLSVTYHFAPLLFYTQKALYPIRKTLGWITDKVSPLLFFFLQKEKEISVEELQHALKESKDRGILLPEETELIRGYLHLQECSIREIMRPKEEILFFDTQDPLSKLIHLFIDEECTRLPLCQGGLDNLLGVISGRIFFRHKDSIKTPTDLIPIAKPAYFVPETLKADLLLQQLYEKKESLAIVVNEYGSISGLITLEDLVELVIGEIVDKRDRDPFFTRANDNEIIASGKLELTEWEKIFEIPLQSETHRVTLGGWLIEQIGEIPKTGFKYQTKDFLFHILSAEPTRIRRIYVRKLSTKKGRL